MISLKRLFTHPNRSLYFSITFWDYLEYFIDLDLCLFFLVAPHEIAHVFAVRLEVAVVSSEVAVKFQFSFFDSEFVVAEDEVLRVVGDGWAFDFFEDFSFGEIEDEPIAGCAFRLKLFLWEASDYYLIFEFDDEQNIGFVQYVLMKLGLFLG